MKFKKSGREVIEHVEALVEAEKEAKARAASLFEREKQKRALQELREHEVTITRLERVLAHVEPDETYRLTEQDLIDFGF